MSVEVIPVSRSMSALESLRDGGVFRALPVGLRDHADQTQVDIAHNRVVVGFDVPLTDPLRTTVAAILRLGSLGGIAVSTAFWAMFWIFGSRVVLIVRPPRSSNAWRSASVFPNVGSLRMICTT